MSVRSNKLLDENHQVPILHHNKEKQSTLHNNLLQKFMQFDCKTNHNLLLIRGGIMGTLW
jgi:hypothetical protein